MKYALVVEDNDDIRAFIREILSAADYHVEDASTGSAALRISSAPADGLTAQRAPMLLLVDFSLPDMNGFELYERMKEQHDEVIAVCMSGLLLDERCNEQLNCVFLQKPFTVRQLMDAVGMAIAQYSARSIRRI